MRAIIHHQFGDASDVLAVEDVATPEPGAGEVRVRTLLSPIHNHDLWTIRGTYGYKPELPARAGTEAVGIVDALGADVTNLSVGQRVATGGTFGVWAEYFVAKAATLMPVADSVPDEVAAQLISMPMSAIALLDTLELANGDWLLQNAANGAVGRLVAQLAVARGINVVGLVRRGARVAELEAQGIGNIVATDAEGWEEKVREITAGAPITVALDSVGGSASGDLVSMLAENGTLIVFGAMESPVMEIRSGGIIYNNITVKGFWGSKVMGAMKSDKRADLLAELALRIGEGSLTLPVEATYSFDEVRAASSANFVEGRAGKVLLRP